MTLALCPTCPFHSEKKEAEVTLRTCVCGEYRVLPACTPTLNCRSCLQKGILIIRSNIVPVPLNICTSSGCVHKPSTVLFIDPSRLMPVICCAFKNLGLACSNDLNSQPFFNPIAEILSKPYLVVVAAIASDTVNSTCDLMSFS